MGALDDHRVAHSCGLVDRQCLHPVRDDAGEAMRNFGIRPSSLESHGHPPGQNPANLPGANTPGLSFDYREFAVIVFSFLVIGVAPVGVILGLLAWAVLSYLGLIA